MKPIKAGSTSTTPAPSTRQLKLFETSKYAASDPKSAEIDLAILRLICVSVLPISITESPAFVDMMRTANSRSLCQSLLTIIE